MPSSCPASYGAALVEWAPILFLVFVFLTGGGSRSDVGSLPVLRAVALLVAFWAASRMRKEDWARIFVPLALLLTFSAWIALQLMPLPPTMWHDFSGRETIVAIDALLGQEDLWRPISMTPSLTLNSLLAMTVPLAVLLLMARVARDDYPRLMFAVVVIACFSALLGLVQILWGESSPVYLYRITNSDSMVGLFANRNHHAVFLACVIPLAAMLLRDELQRKRQRALIRGALTLALLLLTVMTIVIGSRAGFVAGVVAFAIAYATVVIAWRSSPADPRHSARSGRKLTRAGRWLLYSPPMLLAALLGTALWLSSRTTGLTRIVGQDVAADLRVQAWPTVQSMIETYWVLGSGFGSFPEVYKIFEPDNLLQPAYFNRAHNDWAEIVMTGGLPAALILLAALAWVSRCFLARGTRNLVKGYRGDIRLPVLLVIVLLAAASIVDYPLRVPSIQAFAVMLIVFLCCPTPRN